MKQKGFTLIELLITLMIVAILAAVAIPSYTRYVQKARRGEAMSALMRIANAQQKYLLANNETATSLSELNISTTTDSGAYFLSLGGNEAFATAIAGGPQVNDEECKTFRINLVTGAKGSQRKDLTVNPEPGTCWPS